MSDNPVKAPHGQKMIEMRIKFWTNEIAGEPGHIRPKHAWTSGVVVMSANEAHGIRTLSPTPFHSLLDLNSVIEVVLKKHEIKLHVGDEMKTYVVDSKDLLI